MTQEICEPLLSWFMENKRNLPWRQDREPYHVWLSEIMLQQTRVEAVIPYYHRFLDACPTVEHLAELSEQRLLKLWEGLGYYSRARNLQKAAQIICEKHTGIFPKDYVELRALPGVGDYTAGAVASIAFNLPVPAVDGNVLRVAARLDADARCIDDAKVKKAFAAKLQEILPEGQSGNFNQALMELGATVCVPNGAPKCTICPLCHLCDAYALGTMQSFPQRMPKKARTKKNRTVLVLRAGNLIALRRRPARGLLAGMWELPAYEEHLKVDALREQLAKDGLSVREVLRLRPAKHIFTHIEWNMEAYYVELNMPSAELVWVTPSDLRGEYALPSAFRSFLNVIEEE